MCLHFSLVKFLLVILIPLGSETVPVEYTEPPSVTAEVVLSHSSFNAASTLIRCISTISPPQPEIFEPSDSSECSEAPLQRKKQLNLLIQETLHQNQTAALKGSIATVIDICLSRSSNDKTDLVEFHPTSEVNRKLIITSESPKCDTLGCESGLLDVA